MNFVEELKWRGMIQDMTPGTEEQLKKEMTSAYLGIDPTADSLHIGHLVGVMMLRHFQRSGHKPIALIGGATGMIGDPSGKSQERVLIDEPKLRHNQECIKKQLEKFLDFNSKAENAAELVNNYDWMKDFTFLDFIRNVGKLITVNYMMSKDSVKRRISGENGADGMSFTEFSYQLLQGYDFVYLNSHKNCKLQLGGADQWGNITTGTEMIRKIAGNEAFALTCPLITKADGKKFGKTESGNVWLDRRYTSPYKFYQFWLNVSDEDAAKYIKIFTSLPQDEIEALIKEQADAPHLRPLQKRLALEITVMVHSQEDYEAAVEASNILFGNATSESLHKLDEETLLSVFEGVPQFEISKDELSGGIKAIDLLTEKADVFASKGELRKMVQGGGVSINKIKLTDTETVIDNSCLLNSKYILAQKGKKNYFLLIAIE
ncbi:MAG TPA: tyrosine--tRNA ligase [Paludibacteraceae bacterium]|nr:tyrosine--tRNA ligase [Paludibacteraceae bacterium]HOU68902.1 tyrosine--tRNA ligase [Paludibacteraceae bacterium]HPH63432.1 tyrosine--tRNA ligase [Paludibacteraceae bacterium]HQF50684.1 tyrosine--tRNA ligase [Paludibacteraceae bacterium]HQJ91108.1 tyrosine--tRNA ligase [Paludibacteraceae bacterium]